MSSEPSDDTEIPDRDEVDGRGEGQGWWLEERVAEAYERWGFRTATNGRVWGHEIDVVAVGNRRQLIECKDYDGHLVTPRDVWRLIALAYSTGCQPVLAHASPLSDGAAQICRMWRVTRIPVADVLRRDRRPTESQPRPDLGDELRGYDNPRWKDDRVRRLLVGDRHRYKKIEKKPNYYPRG